MALVKTTKEELRKIDIEELKKRNYHLCHVAFGYYLEGGSNGPEAKQVAVYLGILAKETQSQNMKEQLDMIAYKVYGPNGKPKSIGTGGK